MIARTIYVSEKVDNQIQATADDLQVSYAAVVRIILGDRDEVSVDQKFKEMARRI